jgi:hypothetical protein
VTDFSDLSLNTDAESASAFTTSPELPRRQSSPAHDTLSAHDILPAHDSLSAHDDLSAHDNLSAHDTLVAFDSPICDVLNTTSQEKAQESSSPNTVATLLELCANVMTDRDITKMGYDFIQNTYDTSLETIVQNIIHTTSQFSKLLEQLAVEDASSLSHSNKEATSTTSMPSNIHRYNYGHPAGAGSKSFRATLLAEGQYTCSGFQQARAPSQPAQVLAPTSATGDHLVTTSIITTYALIVRVWRHVYYRIGEMLTSRPLEQPQESLRLPGLQLGGVSVGSSPFIQIMVLLELTSGLLRSIQNCLGIRSSSMEQSSKERPNSDKPCLYMSHRSIILREMILSQEISELRPRFSNGVGSLNSMALEEMMDEVSQRLRGLQ